MKRLLAPLLAIVLLATACSDRRYVAMLDRAEPLIETAPDTALALLDSIDSRRLYREDKARYALLHSQALDKNYIDVANDSLINIAVDYYAHSGNEHYKMLAYYYLARVKYNAGDYAQSIVSLLKAEKIALDIDAYFYLGLIYRNTSYIYSSIYYNAGEIEYAQKSYNAFSKTKYTEHTNYALLEVAQAFYNHKDYHLCDSIVNHIIELSEISENTRLYILSKRLKVNLLIHNKMYNEALTILNQLETEHNELFTAIDYINKSLCFANIDDIDNAYKNAYWATQLDSQQTWGLYIVNKQMHKPDSALLYLEKEVELQNKLIRELSNQKVLYEVEKYKEQEKISERKKTLNLLYIIIIITILLISGVVITATVRIKISKAEIERNIALANNLEQSIFNKEEEIASLQNEAKNLFCKQFETLNYLCNLYYENCDEKRATLVIYNDVKSTIQNMGSDKNTLEKLETLANKHLNNIMSNFRQDFPKLSSEDIQLYLYIVMGFSSRAISAILNIEIEKVYNRKSSLKRKINKKTNIDISKYNYFINK